MIPFSADTKMTLFPIPACKKSKHIFYKSLFFIQQKKSDISNVARGLCQNKIQSKIGNFDLYQELIKLSELIRE